MPRPHDPSEAIPGSDSAAAAAANGRAALPGPADLRLPATDRHVAPPLVRPERAEEGSYGWPFWLTYANNLCLMVAMSLLFRYSDFVQALGGTEWHLGWIVGLGAVGMLAMRLFQGVGIDRYGSRSVWLVSVAGFAASCAAHLLVTRVDTPLVFVVRIALATSVAGAFGASITYISRRAPVARMAEIVGTLGTSGFLGMILGTTLGDGLCPGKSPDRASVDRLFIAAAVLGLMALVCAFFATWGVPRRVRPGRRRPPLLWLLRRYHPGWLMLMGAAMGVGIGMPGVFLRPFAEELHIGRIAPYFTVYALSAFVTRLAVRRMPERQGIRPMVLWGMVSLIASILLYLLVREEWQLMPSAVIVGIAHAMLFPAIVAGGSGMFPARHRGVGTTLMLATFDLGNLIGAPLVGGLLRAARGMHWPRYPAMFVAMAAILTVVTCAYAALSRGERRAA